MATAIAASRFAADQIPATFGDVINALPSRQRMSVNAQHAMTALTRSGARDASASAYAPPVESPTAVNRSMSSASATASPSGTQSAMLRPGFGVERP